MQRGGQALAGPRRRERRFAGAQQAENGEQRQQHGDAVEHEERVMAREDEADLDQPGQVPPGAQEGEHLEHPHASALPLGERTSHFSLSLRERVGVRVGSSEKGRRQ